MPPDPSSELTSYSPSRTPGSRGILHFVGTLRFNSSNQGRKSLALKPDSQVKSQVRRGSQGFGVHGSSWRRAAVRVVVSRPDHVRHRRYPDAESSRLTDTVDGQSLRSLGRARVA